MRHQLLALRRPVQASGSGSVAHLPVGPTAARIMAPLVVNVTTF